MLDIRRLWFSTKVRTELWSVVDSLEPDETRYFTLWPKVPVCHFHFSHLITTKMPNQTRDLHSVDKDRFSYIFEQNATVPLKSSDGSVRVNVYRPKTDGKVPVLVTYGPYGKDIPYAE